MSNRWKITYEVWPYHCVKQELAGDRVQTFWVDDAHDMREALRLAKMFTNGVERSPHVWQAPITAIVQDNYGRIRTIASAATEG